LSSRKVYKYKTKTKTKIRTTILNLNIDEDESCKMNNNNNNNNNNKAMSDAELKTFIKQRNINVLSIHHKYEPSEPSVERSCDFCNYVLRLCWLCNQCESCCLYNIDDLECKEK
jgi:hypothetical protein